MYKIICAGEILWDTYGDKRHLGGAPFNVAAGLALKNTDAFLISCVGKDAPGYEALDLVKSLGVDASFVFQDSAHETGSAIVHEGVDGTSRFELPENVAYDFIDLAECDILRISELKPDAYVYGTLAAFRGNLTRRSIKNLFAALSASLRFYDVNLRKHYYSMKIVRDFATNADILKLNDDEAELLSPMLFGAKLPLCEFAATAAREFDLSAVVITRGENGALGFSASEGCVEIPGIKAKVIDTVGAGDAFSAAFLLEYLESHSLRASLEAGNIAGAATVSHKGALPPTA